MRRFSILLVLTVLVLGGVTGTAMAADQYEPNDTQSVAWGPLQSGTHLESLLEGYDWYRFYVVKEGRIDLALDAPTKTQDVNWGYGFKLVAPDSRTLAGELQFDGADTEISYVCTPGWYYVWVYPMASDWEANPYYLDLAGATIGNPPHPPTTPKAPSQVKKNKSFKVYGYLKPRHDAGTYPVRIYKYRKVSGVWKKKGYVSAKVSDFSSYSRYAVSMKLGTRGKWRLRAYAPADSAHSAKWSSGYDYVTVK